jgi:hypothetical protein
MLLRNLPEPADPQQQELHHNIWMLVERAAVQKVESSASHHQHAVSYLIGGVGSQQPNPSVTAPWSLVRGWLGPNYDARNIIFSQQLTHHSADVDQADAGVAEAHQTEVEHEQASPRCGNRPCDRDGN